MFSESDLDFNGREKERKMLAASGFCFLCLVAWTQCAVYAWMLGAPLFLNEPMLLATTDEASPLPIIRGCEMSSIDELGRRQNYKLTVKIEEGEELAQSLDDLVVTMKDAVAMDIRIASRLYLHNGETSLAVSIYHPNKKRISAARKERLRLSAISMSSEQSQTATIEPYERHEFVFEVANKTTDSCMETFITDVGLAILRNAHSVERLGVDVYTSASPFSHWFPKTFLSLGAWKGAFPSLRSAYLGFHEGYSWPFEVSPHLLKHVRSLVLTGTVTAKSAVLVESMIRNKHYAIEEVSFDSSLLQYVEPLADDTLRRVRSFHIGLVSEEHVDDLAGSFERTRAHGDNLVRLSLDFHYCSVADATAAMERILRSRPNLQILNLGTVSSAAFVVLCPVFASSILTTLKVRVRVESEVEDKTLADGVEMLLQHPTIRDLDLTIEGNRRIGRTSQMEGDSVYHFERCVAEGLRATSLRRFHLTVKWIEGASVVALTKMYENASENRSLMDIRLEGEDWLLWRSGRLCRLGVPSRPLPFLPFPLGAFDFISLRNQYLSLLLMLDGNTVPPGLWPFILEWCHLGNEKEEYDESALFYVLTLWPYLVKGKIESSIDADAAKSVDGPSPKRTRIN